MTLQEKILKLIEKVNGLNGQALSLAKRVKALEEKPEPIATQPVDNDLLLKIAKYLGFVNDDEPEELPIEEEQLEEEQLEEVEEVIEESVDEETLEKIDEVINDA